MNQSKLSFLLVSIVLVSFSCTSLSSNQSTSNHSEEDVVATIGDQPILMDHLINYYERNNLDRDYTNDDLKEFLPYYVDFKLKLAYGEKNGIHEDPEILSEFDNYSKQAAFSYWLENDIKKKLLNQYLERSRYEVKSHHILIQLDERSPEVQVEQALSKIEEARELFLAGEKSMEELDREYSTQLQGRSAGGELPWFSVGVTVKPFEDVIFELEPGEISEPVRTRFGYHLIYLDEKRERIPDRKTSHIFFREAHGEQPAEQLSQNAFDALENGRPWDEVVREFSHDGASANSGGDLGWIGIGSQFSTEFIDAVFEADTALPYTEPVQSNYGYHIFKIDSVRTYIDEDHRTAELTKQFEELPRNTLNQQQVFERLAQIGDFQNHKESVSQLREYFAGADTTAIKELSPAEQLVSKTLITFDGNQYSVNNFLEWLLETNPERKANNFSDSWLDQFKEHIMDSRLIDMTRREFSDFDSEIEGFLNGLIVFQISDDNIWNSETADSTLLKEYYEEHKEKYQFGQRFDYTLIMSQSDSVLEAAVQRVKSGEDPLIFSETMENLIVSRDSVSTPPEEIQDVLVNLEEGQISETFRYRNRSAQILFNQMLNPRIMTFDEAFHRVSSDYQPIREELFMKKLHEQFNVQIFPDRIH